MTGVRMSAGRDAETGRQFPFGEMLEEGRRCASASERERESVVCGGKRERQLGCSRLVWEVDSARPSSRKLITAAPRSLQLAPISISHTKAQAAGDQTKRAVRPRQRAARSSSSCSSSRCW
jgi:hypothetical protein